MLKFSPIWGICALSSVGNNSLARLDGDDGVGVRNTIFDNDFAVSSNSDDL